MDGLTESLGNAAKIFEEAEEKRELSIKHSRAVIRQSKTVIHAIHGGKRPDEEVDRLVSLVSEMEKALENFPHHFRSGPAADALAEYAEAAILYRIVFSDRVPSFEELGITAENWILGLADSIGELRRIVLRELMSGDFEKAKMFYGKMEVLADGLLMLDVADAIVPLRRKQDIARSIIERTRSDIAVAAVMKK